ncbi:MAG: pyrimidine 5'-nucleotidase [Rhodocyclaceae bacterium]|nr:pyrimidine 5'-nucleotidase [Rhodocyclaceae bacterium]
MSLTWLFDLDNTLHDANPHIFPHINHSMTAYVMAELGVDEDRASAIREEYWLRYGATLQGLVRHHGTDPHHFLWHTHQFPELHRMLVFESALKSALRRLPGRKILFSNAPAHYAEDVLAAMGVRRQFDAVFAIEHARLAPKPGLAGFLRLLRKYRLNPAHCVMVEDTAVNLRPARRLGMKTVLVGKPPRVPAWVDARVGSVLELPRLAARFR